MNILFIHETDWIDKVVFEIHNLAESLSAMGHAVYAIDYPNKWTKDTKCGTFKNISRTKHGGHVTLLRPPFIKLPVLSRCSAFVTHFHVIERAIRKYKIDAVILYSVATNGTQAMHIADCYNVPVIFRSIDILHELVPVKSLRKPMEVLEKVVYRGVDLILTITPKLSQYVCEMGAKPENVYLLPLLVDTDYFYPKDTDDGNTVLFVGSLHDFSGLYEVISNFPQVLEHCPDAKLLIVGDGDYRYALESRIQKLKLEDSVIMTGFKSYEYIADYINMASVCLCPFYVNALTKDIFPSKIIQYMACGKPVICTPIDGVRESVEGEKNGVLFREHYGIAHSVVSLLKDKKRRQMIGQAGLDYVMKNNSHRIIVSKLNKLISDAVLSSKGEINV